MKVGDGQNSSDPGELLERMREAHREADAGPVDANPVDTGRVVDDADAFARASGIGAESAANAGALDGLEKRLLDTAAKVLDGAFDSTEQVRRAVVETIVSERYAETLGPAQTEQITRTLELTLSDDPIFRREVDNMLLHAARELGRSGD